MVTFLSLSDRNSWCLWKVFIYLLISELFMPAFGYSSLASLLETYTSDLENSEGCKYYVTMVTVMTMVTL